MHRQEHMPGSDTLSRVEIIAGLPSAAFSPLN
jgi:hypothetical protein